MVDPADAAIVPFLCARDAAGAVEFYRQAFGAREVARLMSDGKMDYAELEVFGATVRVCDEWPPAVLSPHSLGGTSVSLRVTVDDVDGVVASAQAAGAAIMREVADSPYGTRGGVLLDPAGHRWFVTTDVEHLSWEEKARRAAAEGDALIIGG